MSAKDIEKGLAEGWLVAEADGWCRFVYDFVPDATRDWHRIPARDTKRVRVLKETR